MTNHFYSRSQITQGIFRVTRPAHTWFGTEMSMDNPFSFSPVKHVYWFDTGSAGQDPG